MQQINNSKENKFPISASYFQEDADSEKLQKNFCQTSGQLNFAIKKKCFLKEQ